MAYTASELAQVRRAIIDLSTGQQVTRITKDGRTVEFAAADLDKLRSLEREIIASLMPTKDRRRTRTRYVVTSKGL